MEIALVAEAVPLARSLQAIPFLIRQQNREVVRLLPELLAPSLLFLQLHRLFGEFAFGLISFFPLIERSDKRRAVAQRSGNSQHWVHTP